MRIRYSGDVVQSGDGFTVKVSFDGIATQAQAQEIGKWLHEAATSYIASKGAVLKASSGDPPVVGMGNRLLI